MVDVWSSSLKASMLGADTTCCGNLFHVLMVLGMKEYMWALTVEISCYALSFLSLRPGSEMT